MISHFTKAFRLFSSDVEPAQLSLGITLGFIVGLSPLISIQTLLVAILLIILRANLSMFITSLGLVSVIAYFLDPLLVSTGTAVLTNVGLEPLFTDMYNNGFWRVLAFNNTVAMGSLLLTLVLSAPIFILSNFLVNKYRLAIEKYWKKSRVFNYIKKSKLLSRVASITDKVA